MAKKIIVYSRNQCASCHMVKTWLKSKQLPYTEVNLDDQPEQTQYVIELSKAMTVPVIVVSDDTTPPKVVVGWQPAKLMAAVQGVAPQQVAA